MSIYTALTRRALVRYPYSDADTLRDALGNAEQLLACATSGHLDAPEHVPAGAMRATSYGAAVVYASR